MERAPSAESSVQPVWCAAAKVVEERRVGPGGGEVRRGTRHFAPGAKVYCAPLSYGPDHLIVVGHHRGSHRYATLVVRRRWLTDWRVELVYSPPRDP